MAVVSPRPRRLAELLAAQQQAEQLFDAIVRDGLIAPGTTELTVSTAIRRLARDEFGVQSHWHKRLVRAGINTLAPYEENPPDRVLADDDIVLIDLGPVFGEWEADLGRTYVLGSDPRKHQLVAALPVAFDRARARFEADPDITGEQLYRHCEQIAQDLGWSLGGRHAGHLIGEFPHQRISSADRVNFIMPGSTTPMRHVDPAGTDRFWILEIHLVDRAAGFGGFFEQLLTTS